MNSSGVQILVVDDEKNMRTTLAAILRRVGYTVILAEDGEEAVEICRRYPVDLVVMDARMPGLTGIEAARQIRRWQTQIKVILMSAYSVNLTDRSSLGEGVIPFFSKPLDIPVLLSNVKVLTQSLGVTSRHKPYNGNGSHAS